MNNLAFYAVSILAIISALGVIMEKNIVRAGIFLVICFGTIASVYFLLRAPFVGASQILIYAVGITLVIIFAIMLTNPKQDLPYIQGEIGKNVLSAVVSLGVFSTLAYALTGGKWEITNAITCPKNTEVIGLKLLGPYILPFELISVLLLVAFIGAIVIAKKDRQVR